MTPEEYIAIRLRNGYICENCVIDNDTGLARYKSPNPYVKMKFPNDLDYIYRCANTSNNAICKTMDEFWDKAKTQKDLLWSIRGLGGEYYKLADSIWSDLATTFNLNINNKITPDDAFAYAQCVRMRVGKNPFKEI